MSDIWSKILDYIIAMDPGRRREEESDYVTFFSQNVLVNVMIMRYEFFCNGKLRENELNMLAVRHTDRQTRSSQRHSPAGGIHEVTVT